MSAEKNSLPSFYIYFIIFAITLTPLVCGFINFQNVIGNYLFNFFTPNLYHSSFLQIIAYFCLFLFFLLLFLKRIFILKSTLFLYCFLFFLWSFLSVSWAHNKFEGVVLLPFFVASLAIFFIIQNSFNKKSIVSFLSAFFISGFLVSLIGICQHLFGVNWIFQTLPPASTFANKNMAAQYIVLTIPLGFLFYIKNAKKKSAYFFIIASFLMAIYIFYTGSKAALISLFFEIFFVTAMLFVDKRTNKESSFELKNKKIVIASAILIVFIMINFSPKGFHLKPPINTLQQKQTTSSFDKIENSTLQRKALWINTLYLIKDNFFWFGTGFGNWSIYYPLYQNVVPLNNSLLHKVRYNHTHNDYIEFFAELGVFGFSLFMLILYYIFHINKKMFRLKGDNKYLILFISTSLLGILTDALFSFPLHQNTIVFTVFCYLAVMDKIYLIETGKLSFYRLEKKSIKLIFIFITFFIFVLSLFLNLKYINYSKCMTTANKAWNLGQHKSMLKYSTKAFEINPYSKKSLNIIGSGYVGIGEYYKAIYFLESALKFYPNNNSIMKDLAISYAMTKNFDKALLNMHKALTIEPESAFLYNNFAKINVMIGNNDKALKLFKLATKYSPTNSSYYRDLGVFLYNYLRRKEEGKFYIKEAIKINPALLKDKMVKDINDSF